MRRQNVCSNAERELRGIVGLALLTLAFFLEGKAAYWGLLGLIPIATAIFKYCPINHLLKIDSCPVRPPKHA